MPLEYEDEEFHLADPDGEELQAEEVSESYGRRELARVRRGIYHARYPGEGQFRTACQNEGAQFLVCACCKREITAENRLSWSGRFHDTCRYCYAHLYCVRQHYWLNGEEDQ